MNKTPFIMMFALVIFTLMTSSLPTLAALEIVEPSSLCERFLNEKQNQDCLKFVDKKKPDTYVASSCQALDDDKLFMECLDFASKAEVDPKLLESCAGDKFSDQERWACLKKTASRPSGSKFQRLPAQISDKPSVNPRKK